MEEATGVRGDGARSDGGGGGGGGRGVVISVPHPPRLAYLLFELLEKVEGKTRHSDIKTSAITISKRHCL